MKTLLDILNLSTGYLEQRGMKNARREAEELISDVLGVSRVNLYMQFDRPMIDAELETCRQRLARRAKGEPWQYISGEVEFLGCKIAVNKHVLIPRQETEILADIICKQLEKEDLQEKTFWDICCGSGCIGIAIKKRFPQLQVVLSDISEEAIQVAKKNAELNQVEIEFLKGDLLSPFSGRKVNFLVSNPPYIAAHEFNSLETEVKDYEPIQALISGPTGLEFYERFAKELKEFVVPQGKAWFEFGTSQGLAIYDMFCRANWTHCRVEKDWSGHDRFFFLENE
jgi:release factor glutamine methyltransferase